jgi:hypothetical protein
MGITDTFGSLCFDRPEPFTPAGLAARLVLLQPDPVVFRHTVLLHICHSIQHTALPAGQVNSMDFERRISIASALSRYRETVSQHSFFLLRALVESMEAQPLPPRFTESVAQTLHMKEFRRYLQGAVPASVQSPRDLLADDVRAEMIRLGGLDGVSHRPVDVEQRQESFAAVGARIAEKNVHVAEFPPADLEYLCTLVSAITGSGLPYNREAQQFAFVSSVEEQKLQDMLENVTVPIRDEGGEAYNELTYVWEDWEIAVAFRIGGGPRSWGGSYALYCRNDGNEQWKWRYGLHDEEWCSDIYDSVEEFLGFYAHFREQTEEDVKSGIRSLNGLLGIRG